MTQVDVVQEQYDKFTQYPTIPYNIIKYLISNDNLIWKLLNYNDPLAWNSDSTHPDLTSTEKANLVYNGLRDINHSRVFLNLGLDDSILFESSILRIGMPDLIPTNTYRGNLTIGFEVLCHYKVSTLSNYVSRDDMILQRLIEVLNGADIPNVGRIFFDAKISSKCRAYMISQIPYRGKALVMCGNVLG